ncbi:hypothetical protein [Flavobacterium piscis]|uniref:Component of toxin-antitoxin plasmid stabilization module n=1 Tax=Flavobacterium piscis TaxID=1114874 RepID=A0ABU1YCN3_9FLAO|nr:hypothetical protein [Flavobacterium piscis]MDR7211997.1 putative component of toxin-antitoxin plasmid stabilization module [Flavobacterium piscis]
MPKFALSNIEAINGKQTFNQLEVNDQKQLDIFETELKDTTYISEFGTLLTYMEYVANNRTLPHTKFKDITPQKQKVKEYEFKSKHLRIYAIQQMNGKIIVLCGFKNNQKEDINKFRSLKKLYLESLIQKKK